MSDDPPPSAIRRCRCGAGLFAAFNQLYALCCGSVVVAAPTPVLCWVCPHRPWRAKLATWWSKHRPIVLFRRLVIALRARLCTPFCTRCEGYRDPEDSGEW